MQNYIQVRQAILEQTKKQPLPREKKSSFIQTC